MSDDRWLVKIAGRTDASGASGPVRIVLVPEPMCMHSTVPVSSHAAKNGSQ